MFIPFRSNSIFGFSIEEQTKTPTVDEREGSRAGVKITSSNASKWFDVGRGVFEGGPKALQKTELDLVTFRPFYSPKCDPNPQNP
jgi:hypothetical protein